LEAIKDEVGADNVEISLGYIGLVPSSYPINSVYLWTSGPEEALLRVALRHNSGVRVAELKERLRQKLPEILKKWLRQQLPSANLSDDTIARREAGVRLSFEPADIISEVMSFGSPTPIEVAVSGPNLGESRAYAERIKTQLDRIGSLRDV